MPSDIKIIPGDIAVDDRGSLTFCNEFNFENVKRSYTVENFSPYFIRAWHGHKKESKYVTVVTGSALIGLVDLRSIKNWNVIEKIKDVVKFFPVKEKLEEYMTTDEFKKKKILKSDVRAFINVQTYKFVCSEKKPSVIYIPAGYINGAMNLENNTKITYYSTTSLGESKGDDYRYYWDLVGKNFWGVEYR